MEVWDDFYFSKELKKLCDRIDELREQASLRQKGTSATVIDNAIHEALRRLRLEVRWESLDMRDLEDKRRNIRVLLKGR